MESATGRFRRDAIKAAQGRAEAEALANNRRDMRVSAEAFVVSYRLGTEQKKFSLFGKSKKCSVIDASIRGLGIETVKGLNKGDKVTLTISDGKAGNVPSFEIVASVMYVGAMQDKKIRYGLQYDQAPSGAYTEFINSETLKYKIEKASEEGEVRQAMPEKQIKRVVQNKETEQSVWKQEIQQTIQKKRIEQLIQKRKAEKAVRKK